jgi:hypothetical protein
MPFSAVLSAGLDSITKELISILAGIATPVGGAGSGLQLNQEKGYK